MKKIKRNEFLVYLFFFIITFCKGIGLSNSNIIYKISYALGILLLFLKVVEEKYTKKELIILIMIIIVGIIDLLIGIETTILFTAIALSCIKNIDVKKIMKLMFWIRLISFILVIIFATVGIIDNNVIIFYRPTIGKNIIRYSLGFSHPNFTHSCFTLIIILFGYCYNKKINIFSISILELLNYLLYKFTYSRTGFFITSFYLVIVYFVKKNKSIKCILPRLLNISYIGFIALSFFVAFAYNKIPLLHNLDKLFTGRLFYMNQTFMLYKIPLFSYNIYQNILFDNGYFDLIYNGGIFATIWFLYFQIKTNKILIDKKLYNEILITLFLLFYSLTESYYASILMNPSLLFLGYSIFNQNSNMAELYKYGKEEKDG